MYSIRRCTRWWFVFLFLKQKTAYEMRISDWSSDVCAADLVLPRLGAQRRRLVAGPGQARHARRLGGAGRSPVRRLDVDRHEGAGAGDLGHRRGARAQPIGRASCRERVCQQVEISGFAVSLQKKYQITQT